MDRLCARFWDTRWSPLASAQVYHVIGKYQSLRGSGRGNLDWRMVSGYRSQTWYCCIVRVGFRTFTHCSVSVSNLEFSKPAGNDLYQYHPQQNQLTRCFFAWAADKSSMSSAVDIFLFADSDWLDDEDDEAWLDDDEDWLGDEMGVDFVVGWSLALSDWMIARFLVSSCCWASWFLASSSCFRLIASSCCLAASSSCCFFSCCKSCAISSSADVVFSTIGVEIVDFASSTGWRVERCFEEDQVRMTTRRARKL